MQPLAARSSAVALLAALACGGCTRPSPTEPPPVAAAPAAKPRPSPDAATVLAALQAPGWEPIPGLPESCRVRVAKAPERVGPAPRLQPCGDTPHCRLFDGMRLWSGPRSALPDARSEGGGLLLESVEYVSEDAVASALAGRVPLDDLGNRAVRLVGDDGAVLGALRLAEHGEHTDCALTGAALHGRQLVLSLQAQGQPDRLLVGDPRDLAHTLHDLGVDAPHGLFGLQANERQLAFFLEDGTLARLALGHAGGRVESLAPSDHGDSNIAALVGDDLVLVGVNQEPRTRVVVGAHPPVPFGAAADARCLATDGRDLAWSVGLPEEHSPTSAVYASRFTPNPGSLSPRAVARAQAPGPFTVAAGHAFYVDQAQLVILRLADGHETRLAPPPPFAWTQLAWASTQTLAFGLVAGHHHRERGDRSPPPRPAVALIDWAALEREGDAKR